MPEINRTKEERDSDHYGNKTHDYFDVFLKNQNDKLDKLLKRLDKLNASTSVTSDTQERSDSLEDIAMDLCGIWKGTMVTEEVLRKQFKLFNRIREQAKTGGEFYALYLVTMCDPHIRGHEFAQNAAAKGHILALRDVMSQAFSGHFRPLKDSIKWGLNCLRYLEETVVPKLEKEAPDSETLDELKNGLARLRERRQEVLPATIPREHNAFNELVNKVVKYRNNRGGEFIDDFRIAEDMIEKLEKNQLLSEILVIPKGKALNEHNLLKRIFDTFSKKINELRSNPEQNKNVIAIAEQLNEQLRNAMDSYISKRGANPALSKEQIDLAKTVFIDYCTTAINCAKPLLEKELGWGDFLTNLLKSLVNVMISATNAVGRFFGDQAQFTLFTPVKAPLIPEVEQIQKDLDVQGLLLFRDRII
ncbi:hypothetical protein [Legionella fallonii]|uniref:DnaJ domain containing protein n=1 Tax=Legionella fallonii LLAP-10 TaxID=1212491 RepID=A0A098G7X1_9GAMM